MKNLKYWMVQENVSWSPIQNNYSYAIFIRNRFEHIYFESLCNYHRLFKPLSIITDIIKWSRL